MNKALRLILISLTFFLATACSDEGVDSSSSGTGCYHNGKELHRGPQGGCYYWNSNNNKTYVDRSECDC